MSTREAGIALDKAGNAKVVFDKANLFTRVLDAEPGSAPAKRVLESEIGKVTLNCAIEHWKRRTVANERRTATTLGQVCSTIAIATNENATAAKQWLESNGYRWQGGDFKTAFDSLCKIRKPGHLDEARAQALHSLLYETELPR